MARALIVSAGNQANQYLATHVTELGYTRPTMAASGSEARRLLNESEYEVVLINAPLPDEFGHELAAAAVEKSHAGVILMVKTGTSEQIADRLHALGVLVLGKPFSAAQFRQSVLIAASCHHRLQILQVENDRLSEKIAQLRMVDRAKCHLIEHHSMTEAEAHRLIEKRAMDTRRSRGEVAQQILEEDEED